MTVHDPRILYFVFQTGCSNCAAAKPELEKFRQEHKNFTVIMSNVAFGGNVLGEEISVVPTYILRNPDGSNDMQKGALKKRELETWLFKGRGD